MAVTPDIDSTETNVKLGITAAIACFVFIGMLQFRDGPFVRPHVAFWRAVLSLSVLYQMALVFFLFLVSHIFCYDASVIYYGNIDWNQITPHSLQNKHQARQMLKFVYPELGVPLPDRSYAEGCELTIDNLKVRSQRVQLLKAGTFGELTIHWILESNRYLCLGPCSWLVCQGTYSSRLLVLLDTFHNV